MPYNSNAKIQIVDSSGDPCDSDAGKLNVTVDGTVDLGSTATNHLSEIEGAVETMESQGVISNSLLNLMNTGLDNIEAPFIQVSRVLGLHTYSEGSSYAFTVGAVRNDTLAALAGTDNEFAPLQVNASGALYVEVASSATLSVNSHAVTNAGTFAVQSTLQTGSATFGKLAANSGVDIGDVDVTSTVHPAGNGTFNSYAQFTAATSPTALTDATNGVNGTETAAKEVIIQADFDNSGYIMVGDSGAAADTNGIRLHAGDMLSLPVANIANIYIDASGASQNVNVTVIK